MCHTLMTLKISMNKLKDCFGCAINEKGNSAGHECHHFSPADSEYTQGLTGSVKRWNTAFPFDGEEHWYACAPSSRCPAKGNT